MPSEDGQEKVNVAPDSADKKEVNDKSGTTLPVNIVVAKITARRYSPRTLR